MTVTAAQSSSHFATTLLYLIKGRNNNKVYSNTSVLVYNAFLSTRYNTYININIYGNYKALKYFYKYIYKGPNYTTLYL